MTVKSMSDYMVGWRNPKATVMVLVMEGARLFKEKMGEEPKLLMLNPKEAMVAAEMTLPWQTCACRYVHRGEVYAGEDTEANLAWCES